MNYWDREYYEDDLDHDLHISAALLRRALASIPSLTSLTSRVTGPTLAPLHPDSPPFVPVGSPGSSSSSSGSPSSPDSPFETVGSPTVVMGGRLAGGSPLSPYEAAPPASAEVGGAAAAGPARTPAFHPFPRAAAASPVVVDAGGSLVGPTSRGYRLPRESYAPTAFAEGSGAAEAVAAVSPVVVGAGGRPTSRGYRLPRASAAPPAFVGGIGDAEAVAAVLPPRRPRYQPLPLAEDVRRIPKALYKRLPSEAELRLMPYKKPPVPGAVRLLPHRVGWSTMSPEQKAAVHQIEQAWFYPPSRYRPRPTVPAYSSDSD